MEFFHVKDPFIDIHLPSEQLVTSSELRCADNLNERLKELKCLYLTFRLLGQGDVSFDKTLQEVADLVPSGWQFSEIACARIDIKNKAYLSGSYVRSEWILSEKIIVNTELVGTIEVAYTEKRSDCFKGPFLEEEVFLLGIFASMIAQAIERKVFEEEKLKLYQELKNDYDKILGGSIPICAFCRNIRDEKGVWQQLAADDQVRLESEFSQIVCPDCQKKLYPYSQNR
jgi:hypothetical protein